jgi:chromosome segregation ATPase
MMSEKHTDKCCYWDGEEFCDCGEREIIRLKDQIAALQAELDNERGLTESLVTHNEALQAELTEAKDILKPWKETASALKTERDQLRTRCEGAESYIKTMAAEASSLQDRIDELAIENDKLKRPVDLYARGLAEGRKAAYEDAVEIVKEVYRTYKGFMATGKGMMQITEETIKSKLGGE